MSTVSKSIADDVVAGKYPDDHWVKIVRYRNAWGGDAYGLIARGQDLNKYAASVCIRDPVTYWELGKE
jgi:hypothetical protein